MILKNAKIVCEDKIINNGWLEIKDNKIIAINEGNTNKKGLDLKNKIIVPGFIDLHTHGGYGVDLLNDDVESIKRFAERLPHEGVTKFCLASIASSIENLSFLMLRVKDYMQNINFNVEGSKMLGIHLEGPFLSSKFKGAHSEELIIKPSIELMNKWIKESNNNISLVSYAIEEQDGEFTKFLQSKNIIASVGHSNATYNEVMLEIPKGLSYVCHLYNAMSNINHRNPGVVLAGLVSDLLVELIVDGHHLHSDIVKWTFKQKTANNIILVTDSVSCKGLVDGEYFLGKKSIVKKNDIVYLKDTNTLAGSIASFNNCWKNMINITNCSLLEAVKMSSVNAAKKLNIFDITGSIAINKLADIVVLDEHYEIVLTICEGVISYSIL